MKTSQAGGGANNSGSRGAVYLSFPIRLRDPTTYLTIERKLDMKPFNLERALAGDPVCYRNGEPVLHVFYAEKSPDIRRLFSISQFGDVYRHQKNGGFYLNGRQDSIDLFMAPVKKTYWMNVYKDEGGMLYGGSLLSTESDAKYASDGHEFKTISFEV